MKLTLLFLLFSNFGTILPPIVNDYDAFLKGFQDNNQIALQMDFDAVLYGTKVHSKVFLEVMPLDDDYMFFYTSKYDVPALSDGQDYQLKGDNFVCLCEKGDLEDILLRWKDGQYGNNDYGKFDCKFQSFSSEKELYHGASFLSEKKVKEQLNLRPEEPQLKLAKEVKTTIFRNRLQPQKTILRVKYPLPVENVVGVVKDESYLISVKGSDGKEYYQSRYPNIGWKSLFPDWKEFHKLNNGFWGTPKPKNNFKDGMYSETFVLRAGAPKEIIVKGKTSFLVKTNKKTSKRLKKLRIRDEGRVFNGDVYFEHGRFLDYQVDGVFPYNNTMSVSFSVDLPIESITVFDTRTGQELATTQAPFEVVIPIGTQAVDIVVEYPELNQVQVSW